MRPNRLPLRIQLALAAAVLSMLAVTVSARVIQHYATAALRQDVNGGLAEIAYQMRDKLDRGMFERWREIRTMAAMAAFTDADAGHSDQRPILDSMRHSFPVYAWIGFAGEDGVVRSSADGILEGADVSARPWFQAGMKGPFVGDLHEAKLLAQILPRDGDEPLRFLDVAAPVFDPSGRPKGVLGAHLSWSWAAEVQDSLLTPAGHRYGLDVMILDRDGVVLLGPKALAGTVMDPRSAGESGSIRYMTGVSVSEGYLDYPGLGWTVLVRQPEDQALASVHALERKIAQTGLAIAAVAALLGWLGATRLTRPLDRLTRAVRERSADSDTAPIPILRDFAEVEVLSAALDSSIRTETEQRRSLQQLNETLESRVRDRTEELARINRSLTMEIEERRRVQADRERLLDELEMLAERDPLTGCMNRRGFDKLAARELARSNRFGQPLSVLVVDLDHFKRVNDTYGHAAGDLVLAMVGDEARRSVRETDVVARFGGEEFVILLTDADEDMALVAAERLRLGIEGRSVSTIKGDLRVTASIGIAQVDPREPDIAGTLELADERLYAAKRGGRNRTARRA